MNLDLNILKGIITSEKYGFEFVFACNHYLFSPEYQQFARHIIDYMKAYRVLPTRRVILERAVSDGNNTISAGAFVNRIWDELDDFEYDIKEFPFDLEKIKNRFAGQSLDNIKQKLLQTNNLGNNPENIEKIIKDVNLKLNEIKILKEGRSFVQETVQDYIDDFKPRFEARADPANEFLENDIAIKTGYSALDNVTDGLLPSEMLIIGGETGAGKSMLLSNLALQMWLQGNSIYTSPADFVPGFNCLYFSLEMPYEDCFRRFMARVADISERSLNRAKLESDEADRLDKTFEFIKHYPNQFQIVDVPRNVTIDEIELRYNDALLKFQPHVVVVDYMGLMYDPRHSKDPDWLKMSAVAGSLHEFARMYKVIMLTAVQLTDIKRNSQGRKLEQDMTVGGHRIGRSSQILHHANFALQIEKRPSEETYGDFKYHIIKNRRGPLASGTLIKKFANASLLDNPYDNPKTNENPTPAPIVGNQPDISNKVKNIQDYFNRKKDEPGS